jgi:hypothetical protein
LLSFQSPRGELNAVILKNNESLESLFVGSKVLGINIREELK